MVRPVKLIIVTLLACFFISSCVSMDSNTRGVSTGNKAGQKSMEVQIPDRIFASLETVPVDVKMICAGILNALRHRPATPFVMFDHMTEAQIRSDSFDFEGFDVTLIDITGFEAVPQGKGQVLGILEGVFHFEDFIGRRASTYFAVKYTKTPDGFFIQKAGVTNIPPLFPRVQAFFVPAVVFDKVSTPFRGFWEIYAFALANAIDMRPTQMERQAYEEYQNLSTFQKFKIKSDSDKQKMTVMIFCMDRISDEAGFEIELSGKNSKKDLLEPGYISENGWPVSIVAGKFKVDDWKSPFEINALYTPQGRSEKLLVGQFINQKDYQSKPEASFQTMQTQPSPAQSATPPQPRTLNNNSIEPGPVASGSVFLNPFLKLDARIIQKRLKELGYYYQKIDGAFGKNSQRALRDFKRENGLRDNATWDLSTQKHLFKGSDL